MTMQNHFALFQLPMQFELDRTQLDTAYREVQSRVHRLVQHADDGQLALANIVENPVAATGVGALGRVAVPRPAAGQWMAAQQRKRRIDRAQIVGRDRLAELRDAPPENIDKVGVGARRDDQLKRRGQCGRVRRR